MASYEDRDSRDPGTGLYPTPVVMVTCVDDLGRPNIITLAWAGVVCSEPPQLGIAVRPSRHSHAMLRRSGQFVVNIPSQDLLHSTDVCGTISGRDQDKFALTGLTPLPATKVEAPLLAQCPVNLECLLRHRLALGSHDLFIGEVVAYHVRNDIIGERGRPDFGKARPFAYALGEYWGLGEMLGKNGLSRPR
ncbi:MAG: flavin reductase family protein [Dehalococcoidia bacterium]|nr:flavin reductase family protein [Dehalococcoidia bacterium]MDP6510668.1 flavin reductase family protein [Dehalococcoidia bacterium]MDP6783576.1 flavin reductase family protein [Dehalococcoidia bacterium]